MGNLTVELDAEALRAATVQAMVGVLTPEVREKILKSAIENILKPSTDSWHRGTSELERVFNDAILQIVRKTAFEMVEKDDDLKGQIKDLMRITADKVINCDQEKLADRMSSAFVSSIRND